MKTTKCVFKTDEDKFLYLCILFEAVLDKKQMAPQWKKVCRNILYLSIQVACKLNGYLKNK